MRYLAWGLLVVIAASFAQALLNVAEDREREARVAVEQDVQAEKIAAVLRRELDAFYDDVEMARIAATPAPEKIEKPKTTTKEKPKKPPAPKDFQTFLFTIQVTMDSRRPPSEAAVQIKKLCGLIKSTSGTKSAIPANLYGVYKADGKVYCEPLPWKEKKVKD